MKSDTATKKSSKEFDRFKALAKKVVSVSKDELQKRKQADEKKTKTKVTKQER